MVNRTIATLAHFDGFVNPSYAYGDGFVQTHFFVKKNITFIRFSDKRYPPLLKHIAKPPKGLHVLGTLPKAESVTIVGTRRATPYGMRVTKEFVHAAVAAGRVTASGLARGIDACVHETTIAARGITVAVLGCGIDVPYPKEHGRLLDRIVETGGAVLSEYPQGTRAQRAYFLQRNRILAGLSPLTIVTEAPYKSGALSTAAYALDANRDVAAVPGPITAETASGTNSLLGRGALVLTGRADLFRYYGIEEKHQNAPPDLGPEETIVLASFTHGVATTVDELSQISTLGSSTVSATLTILELKGLVARVDPLRYART